MEDQRRLEKISYICEMLTENESPLAIENYIYDMDPKDLEFFILSTSTIIEGKFNFNYMKSYLFLMYVC